MNYCRINPESFDITKILLAEDVEKMRFETFGKGSVLYYQDSIKLLIFKKGKAKVVFYDGGDAFTLYYLATNNIFVLEENSVVEFLEESEIYVINTKVFSKVFEDARFVNVVLASMARSLETERKIIKTLVFNDCKKRVVTFLVDVALSVGKKREDGILIDLSMSISEFADFIASKRQTISLILNDLIKDDILQKIDSTKYIIKDINFLKKYLYL